MCFVAAHQDQSFTVAMWGKAQVFAFPICCEHHVSPSQENVGEDHLALKFARQVVKGGLGGPTIATRCLAIPWLLASWLWRRVRANEARTAHELMGALSQRAAKLIHIDLNSLLVPRRFHAPRFAQYRDKSFNESTSHVHVSWNGLCQTATHSIHTINTSLLSLLWASSFVPSIKRSTTTGKCDSEYWRCSHKAAAHFFRRREEPFECFAGRCLWISPTRRLY